MKKFILNLIIICFFSNLGFGQFGHISSKQLTVLKKSKLLVVKSPYVSWNSAVETSLEKYWKLTPYEIVSEQEAEKHYGDPAYSFLTFIGLQNLEGNKNLKFSQLALVLTSKKDRRLGWLDLTKNKIAYVMLDNYRYVKGFSTSIVINGDDTYAYKWNDLFKGFINFLEVAEQKGSLSWRAMAADYMQNKNELKEHTLLIVKSQLSSDLQENPDRISDVYPFKYKLVEHAEVSEAIENVDAQYAYVYAAPAGDRNFTLIIEAGTGKILLVDLSGVYTGAVAEKISVGILKAMAHNFPNP